MATLTRYIQAGKVPAPKTKLVGGMRIRLWSETDIERVREILPKIANGRKTRYQKQSAAQTKPKSKKKPQPRAAVPHEKK